MKAKPASFYDDILNRGGSAFLLPLDESPYRDLFRWTLKLIPERRHVVELGCGTGRLGNEILEQKEPLSYLGLDFSEQMVAEAIRYTRKPECFHVCDLRDSWIPNADVYVATEVLEHLDDDLDLLGMLPLGATVVLSVPSFPSESHVRTFPAYGDARDRYSDLLEIDTERYVSLPRRGCFFHLLRGTRA